MKRILVCIFIEISIVTFASNTLSQEISPSDAQRAAQASLERIPWTSYRIFVRIRNNCSDISCYYSKDGQKWSHYDNSTSVTGSRSVSLYATGVGEVIFRNFKYRGLD